MPTSRKSKAPAVAKRSPARSITPAPAPFLRFHHSHELRARTLEVLLAVESADAASDCSGHLSDLVIELTNSGLDQYFLQPLKVAKASFVIQQSATLGVSGMQKIMGTVVRNVIGRMDDRQLLSVCGSIRRFMA